MTDQKPFHDFLRADRCDRLERAKLLEQNANQLFERREGGDLVDVSAHFAKRLREQAAEIEQLLADAGEPTE